MMTKNFASQNDLALGEVHKRSRKFEGGGIKTGSLLMDRIKKLPQYGRGYQKI